MSDPVVERVRAATDIVSVVGAVVELKKAGASYKGLCPFHQEKTPSFTVNPERQVYHCFGCDTGGDVFSFLMATEGMTFGEALRHLADRAGIEIPKKGISSAADNLQEIIELAQKTFQTTLAGKSGEAARKYLKSRSLSDEIIKDYGVGLAPGGWSHLTDALRRRFKDEELIEAGVSVRSAQGDRIYDRFRNRITFPIARPRGKIAGFGARALGDDEPKYLNSPEGPLYKKSEILFGLPQARETLRREGIGILVEGYFDVLSLAQAGMRAALAPCGTAFTKEQGWLLQRNAPKWILFFDSDPAGQKATWRALEVLLAFELQITIAMAPAGSDPADVVTQAGYEAAAEILKQAQDPISWLAGLAPGEKRRPWLLDRIATLIARAQNPLTRQLWVEEASSKIRIREDALWEAVQNRLKRGPDRADDAGEAAARKKIRLSPLERDLILLVAEQPHARGDVVRAVKGSPGIQSPVRDFLEWVAGSKTAPQVSEIVRRLEEIPGMGGMTSFLLDPPPASQSEGFRDDVLYRLGHNALKDGLMKITEKLKRLEAQAPGDEETVQALLLEKQRLLMELEAFSRH
ncbi:MAG: DNA primase [Candidatus Eisenbacteria bacterium]|uniref:DNA primase n=1 Tax=Eiseniibacteriota bacterium TaxID=2212470 RepID=A0A948W8J4_UNCEI|nr:DNA primase [Candidatus Eisenbacteria bacterium]MBU1947412.1 DNA primase [Candidatus Eisenbacteria bacterium]MBU2693400.1 DNA primase [Candidatus Eisenbacteria bacterium]